MDITKPLFLVACQAVEVAEDPRGSLVQEEPRPDLYPPGDGEVIASRSGPFHAGLSQIPSPLSASLALLPPVLALPARAHTHLSRVFLAAPSFSCSRRVPSPCPPL